jgi:hypothetical protein
MANKLSTLLTFITNNLQSNPLVNTVVFKDDDVLDVEKENIYPLVSILLLPSPKPDQLFRAFSVQFEVLNQRDDAKISTPSKLMLDTNYIDNLGITDSIANDFIIDILKSHNDFDISINEDSISDFEPVKKDERNNLDGVIFSCTFEMHQNSL